MYQAILRITFSLPLILSHGVEVKVKQGEIVGTRAVTVFDGKLYYAFYGVPYAQPPVGKLRFKDPKPLKKWKRPFDARTEYHGACAQAHIVHKHGLYGFEDCLHLNIYTPYLPKSDNSNMNLKPVIVWVHGYAFSSSFSHIHGPDFLIDNDILFISVTHRIGAFGFLKVNNTDTNANMGLKDIVMALRWIKRNVQQFGGNKKRITVMGSGSAGTFLSLLLMTKWNKLFSKMILQSGGAFSASTFKRDYTLEATKLGIELRKKGIQDIMKASTKDIIENSQKIYSSKEVMNYQRSIVPFTPIIEKPSKNSLLTIEPDEFYKNQDNMKLNKTILIGYNSQESISEVVPFLHNPHLLKTLGTFFRYMVPFSDGCKYNYTSDVYRRIATEIKNKYFKNGISEKSVDDFLRYVSDLYKYPIYKFIKTHLNLQNIKVYVYKFNYHGQFNANKATSLAGLNMNIKGASNGDEICYILKCEPYWESYVKINNEIHNRDKIFITEIAGMWATFAKNDIATPPNYLSNMTWLPMTLKEDNVLLISKNSKLTDSKTEKNMLEFWDKIYKEYYTPDQCNKNTHTEL